MRWNNGTENARFEAEQKRLAAEYRRYGMTEEQIRSLYEFDREVHRSSRRYAMHTQPLEPADYDPEMDDLEKMPQFGKSGERLTCTDPNAAEHTRFWWVEELDTPALVLAVKGLSPEDLELLTLYVFAGCSQAELAVKYGVSQKCISQKLARIRKRLSPGV